MVAFGLGLADHMFSGRSQFAVAQPLKKIIPTARTARGRLEHRVFGMVDFPGFRTALQMVPQ